MPIKDIVKGICETTRCKYDVYTKEYMDNLLDLKADKDQTDFAVIEFTMTIPANSTKSMTLSYPYHYNEDSWMILSVLEKETGNTYWSRNTDLEIKLYTELNSTMTVSAENTTSSDITKTYKILLQNTKYIDYIVQDDIPEN